MTDLSWRQSVVLALVAVVVIVLMSVSAAVLTEKSRSDSETPVIVVSYVPITDEGFPLGREVYPQVGSASWE